MTQTWLRQGLAKLSPGQFTWSLPGPASVWPDYPAGSEPFSDYAPPTPALAAAARKSLDLRGDDATGWGIGWRINLWARLRDGERAHAIVQRLLTPERTYPNMFDAHPPFQIDGNFGGAAGIIEMLVQSRPGVLQLLPALPQAWPSGTLTGVRARGGVELDMRWRGQGVTEARVRANSPHRLIVHAGAKTIAIDVTSDWTDLDLSK